MLVDLIRSRESADLFRKFDNSILALPQFSFRLTDLTLTKEWRIRFYHAINKEKPPEINDSRGPLVRDGRLELPT